ncbi:conserved hypothetical protein [Leishmania major strain Friedlin]|uniref:Uncharacterized protein n=1 Tax=Leishmania major TaxID=5664 RepID=Q4QCH9_LEIMA|nr:conserved hypothetical protein [Leishmania major strain Friedlin]CAG9573299.1 hypothetical_protein_-_conserved [Leishmania major strain Friedlin]CAJ03917.1 conserved hypothetical protein [Leishmania major strain Friedlin]|eukprot:XP_001682969.1 conserved hypothetical protein [Leishmania major strain Friedlin]
MATNSEQYWRRQLVQTEAEYEQIIQGLRDEVERQQRRCGDLVHEQAMHRATVAADIRDFCQQYVANANQQQQQQARWGTAATRMLQGVKKDADSIPLPALLTFLHEYSHGLLQLPENRRKRLRQDTQLSPLHHRLRQRMLAHHRRTGREDELMEEWCSGEYGDGSGVILPNMPSLSASSPAWPTTVLPRYADPEGKQPMVPANGGGSPDGDGPPSPRRSGVNSGAIAAGGAAVPTRKASATAGGGVINSGGESGPVMAASAFGLPSLSPR